MSDDAQAALAQVREALANEALFDPGASTADTYSACQAFGTACTPENVRAILAHVEAQAAEISGLRSDLESYIAAANGYLADVAAQAAEIERLRAVLGRIAEGCSFPADDVQRAIRDTARDALKEQR